MRLLMQEAMVAMAVVMVAVTKAKLLTYILNCIPPLYNLEFKNG